MCAACFDSTTVLRVKADGSGTLQQRTVIRKAALAQAFFSEGTRVQPRHGFFRSRIAPSATRRRTGVRAVFPWQRTGLLAAVMFVPTRIPCFPSLGSPQIFCTWQFIPGIVDHVVRRDSGNRVRPQLFDLHLDRDHGED